MWIIRMGKKLNKIRKRRREIQAGKYLSPVRRIAKVAPIKGKKWVAMTFDDGPMMEQPNPWNGDKRGLTEVLLDTLKQYDGKGTFDVIGTTEQNYPDVRGEIHKASWGGVKYDHYPDINKDHLAGVKNLPELTSRILAEGHEITNHGYQHILFGPKKIIYGKRETFENISEVLKDLSSLHNLLKDNHDYIMKLARPPHYIDKTKDGYDAYYAYQLMGYNYLAASFDGGGWLPTCGDYNKDVDKMVQPFITKLKENKNFLNGQIIFQKDGYNMSVQTPIVDALPRQLEILKEYGYEVVTVSQLLEEMPFEDINSEEEYFPSVQRLNKEGYCIGYKNNTFQPDRIATLAELCVMTTHPNLFKLGVIDTQLKEEISAAGNLPDMTKIKHGNPYQLSLAHAIEMGYIDHERNKANDIAKELTYSELYKFIDKMEVKCNNDIDSLFKSGVVKRKDLIRILDKVYN